MRLICDDKLRNVESFTLKCEICGYEDAHIKFYPGYIYGGGGSTGYMELVCDRCNNTVEEA